jgi:hypothetical protein
MSILNIAGFKFKAHMTSGYEWGVIDDETDKALLLNFESNNFVTWVPKSQIEITLEDNKLVDLEIEEWLVKKIEIDLN